MTTYDNEYTVTKKQFENMFDLNVFDTEMSVWEMMEDERIEELYISDDFSMVKTDVFEQDYKLTEVDYKWLRRMLNSAIDIFENDFYEIIDLAVAEWVDGWDSVVFYNPNTNKFESYCWSHSTHIGPDSDLIEVYRIKGNWLACGAWEINDWLDDDEWKDLQEIKEEARFYSPADLDLIGVSFSSRMYDILSFSKDEIIEDMRRSAASM